MYDSALKQYFPEIEALYPYQSIALDHIAAGRNLLAIVPTGGGKSLIYQLPGAVEDDLTLVISPLRALMAEQVDELQVRGIGAFMLTGDLSFDEQRLFLRNLGSPDVRILFVSPERLVNSFFRAALKKSGRRIKLLVIDEAHCISQWGIDFRPEYSCIPPFISWVKDLGHSPTVLALTATLGPEARRDIRREFAIEEEHVEPNVIRDNLVLNFLKVSDDESKEEALRSFIKAHGLRKVVVYLYSKPKAEELALKFTGGQAFHAGMDSETRAGIMRRFKAGDTPILFATTAFGMGINIPDIDGVVHYQIPGSVEEYYQHVGRGARCKTVCPSCQCLVLWSDKNFEWRSEAIEREVLKSTDPEKAFELLNLKNKAGKTTQLDMNALHVNDGTYGRVDLHRIYKLFERHGVCTTLGDVHGGISSIEYRQTTNYWQTILDNVGWRKSFQYAIAKGFDVVEIISHIYDQELSGNVKKLPATERTLFLKAHPEGLTGSIIDAILAESKAVRMFKQDRLKEFRLLCEHKQPSVWISQVLGVG